MLSGQKKALRCINSNDLKGYIDFLASDELRGRETGTNENNIAALYLENNLRRLGIKAPYEHESYLQKIDFISKRINKISLSLCNTNGEPVFSADSILTLFSGPDTADISGDLVFAGYGFEDPKSDYSDLKDVDIRNRIVLVMTRNPAMADSSSTDNNYVFDQMSEGEKITSLLMKGPKAILMVYDPMSSYPDPYRSGLAGFFSEDTKVSLKDYQLPDSPSGIFFITKHTADRLLSNTGFTLKEYQEKINSERKPYSSLISDIKVKVTVLSERQEFTGYNVIGIIGGSDPCLRDECVIFTAHFDHEGVNDEGKIMNGADDNASGTAGLLEIAEAFSHLRKKPLRSVVFAFVNGEEKGLLGSGYYALNPVKPLAKTIMDLNLDMIGRTKTPADTGTFFGEKLDVTGPREILLYAGRLTEEIKKTVLSSAARSGIIVSESGQDPAFGSSDYASLAAGGVPYLFFHSGIHKDLHTPADDVSKIDFKKMEKVSQVIFRTGLKIANRKKNLSPGGK
jgi:hypothetical protein